MAGRDQRAANAAYYRRNRELERERVEVRQHGTVGLLRELRKQACMDCGGRFEPHQMDFDHRDASTKRFRLTSGGAMLRPTAVILDEASKSDVVCANCHRIRTWRRHRARPAAAGGTSRYLDRKRRYWRQQAALLDQRREVHAQIAVGGSRRVPWTSIIGIRQRSSRRSPG